MVEIFGEVCRRCDVEAGDDPLYCPECGLRVYPEDVEVVYHGSTVSSRGVIHPDIDCEHVQRMDNPIASPRFMLADSLSVCRDCSGETEYGDGGNPDVSVEECWAMQLLREEGWSYDEFVMTFERSHDAISTHARGECSHPDLPKIPGDVRGIDSIYVADD